MGSGCTSGRRENNPLDTTSCAFLTHPTLSEAQRGKPLNTYGRDQKVLLVGPCGPVGSHQQMPLSAGFGPGMDPCEYQGLTCTILFLRRCGKCFFKEDVENVFLKAFSGM